MQIRELLQQGIGYAPRGGRLIDLELDAWVPGFEDGRPIRRIEAEVFPASFSVADLFDFESRTWNAPLIHSIFELSSAEAICKLRSLIEGHDDVLIWMPDPRGIFSVKSVYFLLKASTRVPSVLEENEWRLLWKLKIQDWLKLFLWRCGNNAFPFKGRMSEVMHTGGREGFMSSL